MTWLSLELLVLKPALEDQRNWCQQRMVTVAVVAAVAEAGAVVTFAEHPREEVTGDRQHCLFLRPLDLGCSLEGVILFKGELSLLC